MEELKQLRMSYKMYEFLGDAYFSVKTNVPNIDQNGNVRKTTSGGISYKRIKEGFRSFLVYDHDTCSVLDKLDGYAPLMASRFGNNLDTDDICVFYRKDTENVGYHEFDKEKSDIAKKFGKILKPIGIAMNKHYNIEVNEAMEQIADAIKDSLIDLSEFSIVKTDKPSIMYGNEYFDGEDLGSCMSVFHSPNYYNRNYLDFYDENSFIDGLIIYRNGIEVARTLLWDNKYFDNIYAISYGMDRWVASLLINKGYIDIDEVEVKFIIEEERDEEQFPYMDSVYLCYYKEGDSGLTLSNYELMECDGYYEDSIKRSTGESMCDYICVSCGDECEGNHSMSEEDEYVCANCGTVPIDGDFALLYDDLVLLTLGEHEGSYVETEYVELNSRHYNNGVAYSRDNELVCDFNNEEVMHDDTIVIDWGDYEGDYAHFNDVMYIQEHCVHVLLEDEDKFLKSKNEEDEEYKEYLNQ